MSDDAPETAAVVVTLLDIEHFRKSGALLALVSFKCDIGGIELRVQGCQIRRREHGMIELTAPQFKSATGVWLPAVELPDPVMLAVLEQLGDDWRDPATKRLRLMTTSAPPELTLAPWVERKQ